MNLTRKQLEELANQHTGTGYLFLRSAHTVDGQDYTSTVKFEISLGRNGQWYANGQPLDARLATLGEAILATKA